MPPNKPAAAPWWQRGVIYQIYPRSFQDTNGDGIGDLPGVIAHLDYLAWLGVDAIWLSPFYPSPMADFGYDVSNYCDVDPMFGTLADFDRLIAAAHARGIKVVVDFVPNHTSEEHAWFRESRRDRTNAKRDWFIWRDAGAGGGPPNNWLSEFGGAAWTKDEGTGQYFYHAYLPQQPDLNWRNPQVHAAMLDAMRFWLDRGADGFRLDTIHHLFEDAALRDNPPNPHFRAGMAPTRVFERTYQIDQPEVQDVLHTFRRLTDGYTGERVLIGEAYLPLDKLMAYYGKGEGVHLPFNFQMIGAEWNAHFLAELIMRYEALLPRDGWPNWVLGNHDRSRVASRFGRAAAPVAAMLLLTLRGTPTLYYGDELGLEDVAIPPELVQDPWEKRVPGHGLGRDPMRTPMPWNSQAHAGFTTGTPWLPLNPDFATVNVASELGDPASLLNLTRALIALRRKEPALTLGGYGRIQADDGVLFYERVFEKRRLQIALNLGAAPASVAIDPGKIRLSTGLERRNEVTSGRLQLAPQEGVIVGVVAAA